MSLRPNVRPFFDIEFNNWQTARREPIRASYTYIISRINTIHNNVLLPYGQVGVDVRDGLETAIHTLKSYITTNSWRENLRCFRVDMRNAINECHCENILQRLREEFPELFACVQWSYSSPGELRFGKHRILSKAGAQQRDPLGPMLNILVLDNISNVPGIDVQLWYSAWMMAHFLEIETASLLC